MKKNNLARYYIVGNLKMIPKKTIERLVCEFCGAPFGPNMMIYGNCCSGRKLFYANHPEI